MQRSVITRALALLHRVHRWTGTAMASLMAVWFASGAVMTFKAYPAYTDAERLAQSQPLMAAGDASSQTSAPGAAAALVPDALMAWLRSGGLAGGRARLSMLEGEPRWLLRDAAGYRVLRTQAPWEIAPLDATRARAVVEHVHGACRGPAARVNIPDQWTVGRTHPGSYPLWRIACDDELGSELYVSARSGEIVQASTRSERVWAWLGPIAHWVYPALLRRERELWRDVVLWVSAIGCIVTVTGMLAGVHSAARSRRSERTVKRQVYLRWHQRLGLGFGAAACAWVFSGALSLEPFHWSSPASEPGEGWSRVTVHAELPQQLTAAVSHCREQLPDLREVELIAAGHLYALCSDAAPEVHTRIVDLEEPRLTPRERIADQQLQRLAHSVAAQLSLATSADDYYYPTHRRPIALPYARFALADDAHTVLYFDPARGELIDQIDDKRRWERWLYHGLHSWDFPALYRHRTLWRMVVIAAMLVGTALAVLGLLIFTRRQRRTRARPSRR
jgi:hypothetical protein